MVTNHFPLFPLPVVLFPGMVLPLHIFEERYRLMISQCLATSATFGVVLSGYSSRRYDRAYIADIGTIARIVKVSRYSDGRMDLLTVGRNRFRVLDTDHEMPYMQACIDTIEDHPDVREAKRESRRVASAFLEYGALLNPEAPLFDNLPSEPEKLSYVGHILDIELEEKQELLEITSVCGRLTRLESYLRREIALVKHIGITRPISGADRFSLS